MFRFELNDVKIYCLIVLLATCFVRCDDSKRDLSLRSDTDLYLYRMNNEQASERLSSMMYNTTNPDNPVERFKLVHISDIHVSDESIDNNRKDPKNLKEAITFANQNNLKINALAATGDFIDYSSKKNALSFLQSFFDNLYSVNNTIPTFPCYGNHDSNTKDGEKESYINTSELYNAFDNRGNYSLQKENRKNYYYADVPNPMGGVIRFIALDMLDQPGNFYNTLFNAIYSQEQINWLGNVALQKDMTDGHSVVVLTHYPFQSRWGRHLQASTFVHEWRMIPEIIEAFRTKQNIEKSYKAHSVPAGTSEYINTNFDFSVTPGEFICHLAGHIHFTEIYPIERLSNQSVILPPQLMLIGPNMLPNGRKEFHGSTDYQGIGAVNNSFCIYAIDTNEKKIYATYFGSKPLAYEVSEEIKVLPYMNSFSEETFEFSKIENSH